MPKFRMAMWILWCLGLGLILLGRLDVVDNQTAWCGFWITAAVAVTARAFPSLWKGASQSHCDYSDEEIQSSIRDLSAQIDAAANPSGRLFLHRGMWRVHAEQYSKAIRDLTKALQLDASLEMEIRYWRGLALLSNDQPAAAIDDLSVVISADHDSLQQGLKSSALQHRASAEYILQNFEAALADLRHSLLNIDSDEYLLCLRGKCRGAITDFRGAIEDFEAARRIDPKCARAWLGIAGIRSWSTDDSMRDGHEAVQAATQALRLASDNEWWFLNGLAGAYAEAGDFASAIAAFQKSISMLPDECAVLSDVMQRRIASFERHEPVRLHDSLHTEKLRIEKQAVIDREQKQSASICSATISEQSKDG